MNIEAPSLQLIPVGRRERKEMTERLLKYVIISQSYMKVNISSLTRVKI